MSTAATTKATAAIQRAIGHHDAPSGADMFDIPGVVHAANALVQALDLGGGPYAAVPRLLDGTWDGLRLKPEHLLAACREIGVTENPPSGPPHCST